MVTLTAGELPHRVSVFARTVTGSGDSKTETYAVLAAHARRSANVKPLHGRDLERARQVDPRISHEVTLRYWRDYRAVLVGGRVRLVYHPTSVAAQDRVFELIGPPLDVEEAHVALRVTCREMVA